tara:strand:- start:1070 stop:1198 length:129 start_codon:yes stop_codon:yes gene_type:complete
VVVKVVMEKDQDHILIQEKEVQREDQVAVEELAVHQHKNVIQ